MMMYYDVLCDHPHDDLCWLQKRPSGVVSNAPRAADAGHGEVEGWPPETLISAELSPASCKIDIYSI